jgi:hypothetical protein
VQAFLHIDGDRSSVRPGIQLPTEIFDELLRIISQPINNVEHRSHRLLPATGERRLDLVDAVFNVIYDPYRVAGEAPLQIDRLARHDQFWIAGACTDWCRPRRARTLVPRRAQLPQGTELSYFSLGVLHGLSAPWLGLSSIVAGFRVMIERGLRNFDQLLKDDFL